MWGKYERGSASPGCDVMTKFSAAGADVLYILTGRREREVSRLDDRARLALAIEAVEEGLAAIRRTLPPAQRAEAILAAYDLMAEPVEAKKQVVALLKLVA